MFRDANVYYLLGFLADFECNNLILEFSIGNIVDDRNESIKLARLNQS